MSLLFSERTEFKRLHYLLYHTSLSKNYVLVLRHALTHFFFSYYVIITTSMLSFYQWGLPFGGPAVGVLTAASAGYMYPLFARLLWPTDLQSVMGFAGKDRDAPSFTWYDWPH